jgi:hypothetical protein
LGYYLSVDDALLDELGVGEAGEAAGVDVVVVAVSDEGVDVLRESVR